MTAIRTLLALPFAKLVLAFEARELSDQGLYEGLCPYAGWRGGDYVRWAVDSIERLLTLPHEDRLDDALMHLALHTGEPAADLCMSEIHDGLRRLCADLQLAPPTGQEAVKLFALSVLEDLASGFIPTGRTRDALNCLYFALWPGDYGDALNAIPDFEWRLEEWDDLSMLGLEQGLPTWDEILQEFRRYAETLVKRMRVELEQHGGLWHLRVAVT